MGPVDETVRMPVADFVIVGGGELCDLPGGLPVERAFVSPRRRHGEIG